MAEPHTGHPPGRLRARAGLEQQQITVPANLRGLGLIYWTLCLTTGLGGMLVSVAEHPEPEVLSLLLAVIVFVAVLFFVARAMSALLHWSNRSHVGAIVSPMLLASSMLAPVYLVGAPAGLYAGLLSVFAFYWWFVRWLALPATFTIDQANLTITHGKLTAHSRVIPLEDIRSIQRSGSWWPRVMLGAVPVPILAGLTETELAWLSNRLCEEAQRRRRQLADSGHDLQQPAAPPPDLQRLRAAPERP